MLFLQNILDSKEDYYAEVKRRDPVTNEEKIRSVSVKIKANHLLSGMPDEGLNIYELEWGGKAKDLLQQAKKKSNIELLAEVAQHSEVHPRPASRPTNCWLPTSSTVASSSRRRCI